jgi:lipid-A-disaccharide synthase
MRFATFAHPVQQMRVRGNVKTARPIRIGIVAGEVSGDILAAGLIRELKRRLPGVQFEGIGGPRMQAEGCQLHCSIDQLSGIGLEILERVPEIIRIRHGLARHFKENPPDLFIGVDAPDFNLSLEQWLRKAGIRTLHYVSPTVWAWRRWRIHKIRRAVDHMLCVFPFEEEYYREHGVPVTFVGHPLADAIPLRHDQAEIRRELKLPVDRTIVGLLPGSRMSELRHHADLFVETALWLYRRYPELHFVVPFASEQTKAYFEQALERHAATALPLTLMLHGSREAMAAADIVLCASGTVTLEAALIGRPMVVTYRVSWLSYLLIRPMLRVRFFALPNILAGKQLVPEYVQADASVENLGKALARLLTRPKEADLMQRALKALHRALRRGADRRAAKVVIDLLSSKKRVTLSRSKSS